MSAALVAQRYAKAFVDAVGTADAPDTQAFFGFCDLVDGQAQLQRLFANVTIAADKKVAVIEQLSKRLSLPDRATRFLNVLAVNGRIGLLTDVRTAVQKRLDEKSGIQQVDLIVAVEPPKTKMSAFEKKFEKRLGTKIRVTMNTDDSLLAGAIAKVGSTVYDGSLRGRLQRIRKELMKENA